MFAYAQALGEDRRANPRDDITSVLMHAEVDGDRLTSQEFGSFFILLVVAGNETTRNAISHGMKALTDHPDQRDLWFGDFDGARQDGGRGDRPLGDAGDPLPPHGDRGHRAGRQADRRRRQGRALVQLGQPRRARLPPTRTASTSPARCSRRRSASAPAVRTSASAPTWPGGRSTVMFDELRRRLPDLRITGEPEYLQSVLHQRHQAPALHLDLTSSRALQAPSSPSRKWRRQSSS